MIWRIHIPLFHCWFNFQIISKTTLLYNLIPQLCCHFPLTLAPTWKQQWGSNRRLYFYIIKWKCRYLNKQKSWRVNSITVVELSVLSLLSSHPRLQLFKFNFYVFRHMNSKSNWVHNVEHWIFSASPLRLWIWPRYRLQTCLYKVS